MCGAAPSRQTIEAAVESKKNKYEEFFQEESEDWNGFQISKLSHGLIEKVEKKGGSMEDFAYGCVLGGQVGDSMGSYIEFITEQPDDELLEDCLQMYGGGPHGVGVGQITDDSEMGLSLMWAIVAEEKKEGKLTLDL